jgi:hypothetical protein
LDFPWKINILNLGEGSIGWAHERKSETGPKRGYEVNVKTNWLCVNPCSVYSVVVKTKCFKGRKGKWKKLNLTHIQLIHIGIVRM